MHEPTQAAVDRGHEDLALALELADAAAAVTLPRFGYSNPVWVQPGLMLDTTIPIGPVLVSP